MPYCLNPACPNPEQPGDGRFCQQCGTTLRLRERYVIHRLIGQGGFGRTFLAADGARSHAPCVIKQFLPADQDAATYEKASHLFLREALRLNDLGRHPQIPDLWAYFEQGHQQFLVQEFVDGVDLEKELAESGRFDEAKILALLQEVLPVFDFIHQHQVIHRDIKPANIIRRNPNRLDAPPPPLVLVDFGAAKLATATALARTGTVIGSAGFVSPEQLGGKAEFASDLYSLGVTCIHLLTDVDPFTLYSFAEDGWVWRDYLAASVSVPLGQMIDRLIARPLKARYRTAAEALAALAECPTAAPPNRPALQLPTILQDAIDKDELIDDLPSAVGVDYAPLRDLLAIANWSAADDATRRIMLQAFQRKDTSFLSFDELTEFPCLDLRTINRLWMKYSNGHLGFEPQLQAWNAVGHPGQSERDRWQAFSERIGWLQQLERRVGHRIIGGSIEPTWISQPAAWGQVHDCPVVELKTTVPTGFLPYFACLYRGSSRGGKLFLERLQTCEIS
ncbi:MAG: serine/threonine-protein kinase [Cyanobacteria bacterium J06638_20]